LGKNWGRERHLRCVDRQLGRYPGYKECGRNGGKNGKFHCESDQTHEGTTTTGKKAVWREAAWGGTSDEKKVGTIERSDFIRRLFICHISVPKYKTSRMPLHTVVTAQPNQHLAPWPRDPVRAKTPVMRSLSSPFLGLGLSVRPWTQSVRRSEVVAFLFYVSADMVRINPY
jgi:hypothetical protein